MVSTALGVSCNHQTCCSQAVHVDFDVSNYMPAYIVLFCLYWSISRLDDIEDGSALRRGHPASHVLFGLSQTINSATYAVVKAFVDVECLKEKKCRDVFVGELLIHHHQERGLYWRSEDGLQSLCNGQGLELYWRFHGTCPSPEDYITMIDNKTGSFFKLIVELMETESRSSPTPNLLQLTTLIGRYYQIRDDYNNLASDEVSITIKAPSNY